MIFHLSGVHVPHRKNTAGTQAERMDTPKCVTIPMAMHIGKPAIPSVKVGDAVCVGTLIAEQDGFISSPIYSSISGKVTKISDILLSNGSKAPAITIESDGNMTPDESIAPPEISTKEDFVEAVRKSGVVGLGGAGFPTYVKFNVPNEKIEELIINGAECEPYITSDSNTMENLSEDIAFGLSLIEKYLGVKKIIIGIEKNKKAAIASMKALAANDACVSVKVLPSVYPQGGEKVLVYHTTGKVIPMGKLPIDVGCIVCNCTTVAAIGNFVKTGMPLVNKCVTVDGGAIASPKNVIAPIGTSIADLIEFCGGFKCEPKKILYGGPMMGIAVPDTSAPVLKNTNAILALTEKEMRDSETSPCIRCGSCLNTCPFGINPAGIARALDKKDVETMEKLGANLCMECGCCSFVCPAHIQLVQSNKLAKAVIKEEKAKEASAK